MAHKTWEDYLAGQQFRTSALTVTETHVVVFSGITGDYHPLHMNEEYAKQMPFKTRIAQGPLIFSMAVGLVIQAGVFGDSVIAWLGGNNLKFIKPVIPGDTVYVEAEVLSTKETSAPDRGIANFLYTVKNQHEETVVQVEMTFLMHRSLVR